VNAHHYVQWLADAISLGAAGLNGGLLCRTWKRENQRVRDFQNEHLNYVHRLIELLDQLGNDLCPMCRGLMTSGTAYTINDEVRHAISVDEEDQGWHLIHAQEGEDRVPCMAQSFRQFAREVIAKTMEKEYGETDNLRSSQLKPAS
jgi:hypothetical protein